LRICAKEFDLTQFTDAQRHLSNFSINKEDELVMSTDDFCDFISKQRNRLYTWENDFLPQVHKIVNSVLIQCNESFEL